MLNSILKQLSEALSKVGYYLDRDKLVKVLIIQESANKSHPNGDDYAIGDLNLIHKAYGCLQIRQPYVDDVNVAFGTSYVALDCLGNRKLSLWIFDRYMDIYGSFERFGRRPTMEEMARIHNGGPNGHKNPKTVKYWNEVRAKL